MPDIAILIGLYCAGCGEESHVLVYDDVRSKRHGVSIFQVWPCPKCLEAARDEGREEGRKDNT